MADADLAGSDWTDREIDLIVADYFEMLRLELLRQRYNKAERNRAMQEMTGRSRGSIEFKHQNVSAVLQELCRPWIAGYKPRANYQHALIDGIERYLEARGENLIFEQVSQSAFVAEGELFLEVPPLMQGGVEPNEPLRRLIRKFDPAGRDARNRKLGRLGEERILKFEHARLSEAGRNDLARKVKWVSDIEGDGAGYDILSFSADGAERLLEVKTTTGYQLTPFYLTENERALSAERPDAFRLVRVYDFLKSPRVFELKPPLEESVMLRPTNYRASFGA